MEETHQQWCTYDCLELIRTGNNHVSRGFLVLVVDAYILFCRQTYGHDDKNKLCFFSPHLMYSFIIITIYDLLIHKQCTHAIYSNQIRENAFHPHPQMKWTDLMKIMLI